MAPKTPSRIFRDLKERLDHLSDGSHSASDVASTLNDWARESADTVKERIHEEVEAAVLRMGFIKRDEYEKLVDRVAKLEGKSAPKKRTIKKSATKKVAR